MHFPLSALDRKTLRDLWHMKGQAVAIALVIVDAQARQHAAEEELHRFASERLELPDGSFVKAVSRSWTAQV